MSDAAEDVGGDQKKILQLAHDVEAGLEKLRKQMVPEGSASEIIERRTGSPPGANSRKSGASLPDGIPIPTEQKSDAESESSFRRVGNVSQFDSTNAAISWKAKGLDQKMDDDDEDDQD